MSDGLNQARAFRVTEIMTDFRNILMFLSQIRTNPTPSDYHEEIYVTLRQCVAQGQALLNEPFNAQNQSRGDDEQGKANLRRIITDAAYRRFKAKKIYLRARAALRGINARQALLQGQPPNPRHAAPLQQITSSFRSEMASITDQGVESSLRASDMAEGKWLNEDPSLTMLQRMAAANGGGNGRH